MKYVAIAFAFALLFLTVEATRAGDLGDLPEYRPATQVAGVLRIRGSQHLDTLLQYWGNGFRQYHPGIAFENTLKGNASAMIGLEESVADMVAMSRQIVPYDTYGVWRRSHRMPIEITVATGSFDVPGKSSALVVFVHKDNPLASLTLQQLDGIFGAQRTGGWKGMEWEPAVARTDKDVIRTWGQLGVTGEWADKPIHTYGPPGLFPGGMSFFQIRVMGGADSRAEGLQEYADPQRMMVAMSADRYGIAYTGMSYRTSDTKAMALAETPAGPFVEPTRETVREATYPLARSIYIYLPPDAANGDSLDPRIDLKVEEFLRYVLSRQGQQEVIREGNFLPLTARAVGEQLRKLQ